MFLKSLTLKGFKSFASATTLRFEPGVTCVVGPNGSGKSNVVDAISWVLGEQGAKSLRGGKMEDVIFAGTRTRPPLGRAEVVLTIDNADGALPIDYAEVTISRLMYRSGESEYAINGGRCRLLDVQELLSDSGIGREMHVIVGQGQLDGVLHASPEERRAYIEEAAGILKHRRRKEKALRKLAATDQNLARLQDLLTEIRRQLKPLGRQADAARRAAVIQADVRDARARLCADDLARARDALARSERADSDDRGRRDAAQAEWEAARARLSGGESEARAAVAEETAMRDLAHRLGTLRERFVALVRLAEERARSLEVPVAARAGRDPEALEREAATAEADAAAASGAVAAARADLAAAVTDREAAERSARAAEQAYVSAVRAAGDRREGLARLQGEVAASRARLAAAADEIGRATAAHAAALARGEEARGRLGDLQAAAGALDDDEADLDGQHAAAEAALAAVQERLGAAERDLATAERDLSAAMARADTLAGGLSAKDGAAAVLAERTAEVLGPVGSLVTVRQGFESALAAALGAAADAVAVRGVDGACTVLGWLRESGSGRTGLLGAGGRPAPLALSAGALAIAPAGCERLADLVGGPEQVAAAVRLLVADVVVVADLAAGHALVAARPDLRAVTVEGDLVGALWAAGGSAGPPSIIEVHAAHEAAVAERESQLAARTEIVAAIAALRAEVAAATTARDTTLAALHESDARMAAAEEELTRWAGAVRTAEQEVARLAATLAGATVGQEDRAGALRVLQERLAAAEAAGQGAAEPDPAAKEAAAGGAAAARKAETEARLALRAAEERNRGAADRAERLHRAARSERQAREEAERVRQRRAAGAVAARQVVGAAETALAEVEADAAAARDARDAAAARSGALGRTVTAERAAVERLAAEVTRLTDVLHREDVQRAEHRLRVEQVEARATAELRLGPEELLAEYGPDVPLPGDPDDPEAPPVAFDRAAQERRLAKAEKELARLGTVNPLALEEFAALEERHDFLVGQVQDVAATRRELMTVVREVDERIRVVFAEAYADVEREFRDVFATLFPGGEGRLLLTDPEDPLTTGVDVEARPPGKKVKRLSLLSGGERSLTAIAMLVAIFRARPSPFYVLDEVEAALDDVNLGRLVGLLETLRPSSQLVVITHQKRTMEAADALYGVSMRGDGVSQVISQKLRRVVLDPAADTAGAEPAGAPTH